MATTQRSSLPLPASLRHDLLCHPHAPGLVFLTNLVWVLRAGVARLALRADRKRDFGPKNALLRLDPGTAKRWGR
jgi:hypothetical protein